MTHFVATTEGTSAERLVRLFSDNVWKLHGLLESVVSDRGPQFAAELTKELNRMLGIKTKLSTAFHPQTDGQTERMNQELEQRYVGPYAIEEVVSSNAVKLCLPSSMRIHPVVNVSRIVCYKEQVKGQKKEEGKPVEVEGVEEWEVEKILNKKKMRGVEKYLIR